MRLDNKVALITGAASGMGASMARIFAGEGGKIVVADLLEEEGKAVVAEITRANGAAMFQRLDVSSEAEWKAAVDATVAAYGRLDILVNDAGLSGSAVADLFDTAAWDRLMAVNARGVFLGMKFAVPIMKAQGGGSIVNISSISGIGASARTPPYGAVKAAILEYTQTTAAQFARKGIRVNCIAPGSIEFPGGTWERAKNHNPNLYTAILRSIPFGRLGRPEEVARVALFLASPLAGWVTGQNIAVDGGQML